MGTRHRAVNGKTDIFVHDRQTGATTRVSVSSKGDEANGWSYAPTLSADGRFVGFKSSATNLLPEDTNNSPDLFITINPLWTPPPGP